MSDLVSISEISLEKELREPQKIRQQALEGEHAFAHDTNVDGREAAIHGLEDVHRDLLTMYRTITLLQDALGSGRNKGEHSWRSHRPQCPNEIR